MRKWEKRRSFFYRKGEVESTLQGPQNWHTSRASLSHPKYNFYVQTETKTEPSINDNGIDTNLCRVVQSRIDMS